VCSETTDGPSSREVPKPIHELSVSLDVAVDGPVACDGEGRLREIEALCAQVCQVTDVTVADSSG
jgi:hypothetical protein